MTRIETNVTRVQHQIDRLRHWIEAGVAPFKPGRITIYRDTTWIDHIFIDVSNLPEHHCAVDLSDACYVYDDELADFVGQKAAEYFRSIPREPTSSNIQLGEN